MTTPDPPSPIALEEIIRVAAELPAGERAAYLETVCEGRPEMRARIERMREVGGIAALLQQGANETVPPEIETELDDLKSEEDGERMGNYKLLQQIGEGGFGVVWMAQQLEPVQRRVALKIIKLGMDTKEVIARFEQERQALAMMDHSNIAKVFDAGTTPAGRPFFVMELVKGMPITKYCDEAGLGTRERLALFGDVCSAINHAHQKGVIHRDIKPSNVMVTLHGDKPVVKVIDFGIAKATQGKLTDKTIFTRFEQFIGTPVYMSPEQASMSGLDVDTRSDIYALGILLYELLTGKPPFDAKSLASAGYEEMRRIIREVEPVKPSSRLSTVAGEERLTLAKARHIEPGKVSRMVEPDLDWIVMKAIEKDRARRYETANAFAKDIKRFLDNEPVDAGAPSATYRLRKFARRNRGPLAAAAGMVALLVAGVVVSTWQAVKASAAEKRATQKTTDEKVAREDAEAVSKFLSEVFQSPDPTRDGLEIKVAELLDKAAKKLDSDLASQPGRRARLQATLGSTYEALGLAPQAIPLLEKARDYYRATLGPEHPATIAAMSNLAVSLFGTGRREEALKLKEEVLPLFLKVQGLEHPHTLSAMTNLALSYCDAGRREEALKLQEKVLLLSREVRGPEHPDTLAAMFNLAKTYFDLVRKDEALALREEVLTLRRKLLAPNHPDTLAAISALAHSYADGGRLDEAIRMQEEVLPLHREVNGRDHPTTLNAMNHLAVSYYRAPRLDDAIKVVEESMTLNINARSEKHPDTLEAMSVLAGSYAAAGRLPEAIALQEKLLPLSRDVHGRDHPHTLGEMTTLALYYSLAGRFPEAIALQEEALPVMRRILPSNHSYLILARHNMAKFYEATGRHEEAAAFRKELADAKGPAHSAPDPAPPKPDAAPPKPAPAAADIKALEAALELASKDHSPEHPDYIAAMTALAAAYGADGSARKAIKLGKEALALARGNLPAGDAHTIAAMKVLVPLYKSVDLEDDARSLEAEIATLSGGK